MYKISTACPGKCILSGEHAIVYGHPAITMALDVHTRVYGEYTHVGQQETVRIKFISEEKLPDMALPSDQFIEAMVPLVEKKLPAEVVHQGIKGVFAPELEMISLAFAFTLKHFNKYANCFSSRDFVTTLAEHSAIVTIEAPIPQEAGLGSSASYFGALILNFYAAMRKILVDRVLSNSTGPYPDLPDPQNKQDIETRLEEMFIDMERVIHGQTTGVDVKTVLRGGMLAISKEGVSKLITGEAADVDILLIDSEVRAKTSEAVGKVRQQVQNGTGTSIINEIGDTTSQILSYLKSNSLAPSDKLNQLVAKNQQLLKQLGLSIQAIDEIVQYLAKKGIPAKLSGKGMGGFIVAIVKSTDSDKITSDILQGVGLSKSYSVIKARQNQTGITCSCI